MLMPATPCGGRTDAGREAYYRFDSPVTGTVTVEMTPFGGDFDLIAIGANASGCLTGTCVAAGQLSGTRTKDTVTFPVTQGQARFLVVDSFAGATGGYSIKTTCTKQ